MIGESLPRSFSFRVKKKSDNRERLETLSIRYTKNMNDEEARDYLLAMALGEGITPYSWLDYPRAESLLKGLIERVSNLSRLSDFFFTLKLNDRGKEEAMMALARTQGEIPDPYPKGFLIQERTTVYRYEGWKVDWDLTRIVRAQSDKESA